MCFAALMAAALEPRQFKTLMLRGENAVSLRHLIDLPEPYEACQPMFCFGFLEIADIPELMELLDDVTLYQPDRHLKEEAFRSWHGMRTHNDK